MLTRATMALYGWRYWRPLERMAAAPERTQLAVLRGLVDANQETRFGREHRFASVRNVADFQARVPVQTYEELRAYVEEQRTTGNPALTAEAPLFYAQTSGSTGAPKLIPITPRALAMHREEQALFSYLQYRACPEAYAGDAWGIMGAAVEAHLDSGHTVGSVSGHLYQSLPRIVQSRFVVPPSVSTIADYELKYAIILQLALAAPNVSYIGAPNPSTFLRLIETLNYRRDELLAGLAAPTSPLIERLPVEIAADVRRRLVSNPARARELARLPSLTFANVWPGIRLVTTWTGGSCGIALGSLRSMLPPAAKVMELGYQSSEFRGTVALFPETSAGLPALHHHFFEFADPAEWDAGQRRFLTLEALRDGSRYYVIVTTAAGLYRYFMNDLVEVDGRFHDTPLLRFVQKGKGVTSLTGEKLYEGQMIQAVQESLRAHAMESPFFIAVADEATSSYVLYVEGVERSEDTAALTASIDARLGELNIEYRGKRESGRISPLALKRLRSGAAVEYKAACVRAGQREGQFKPTVLQYRRDLTWQVETCVAS